MKHNGVGFTVVQGIRRGNFVWMAETDPPRQGEAQGRDSARGIFWGVATNGFWEAFPNQLNIEGAKGTHENETKHFRPFRCRKTYSGQAAHAERWTEANPHGVRRSKAMCGRRVLALVLPHNNLSKRCSDFPYRGGGFGSARLRLFEGCS